MPLVKGKEARTEKGFAQNIKTEMKRGRPQKQAVAIAYGEADSSRKSKMPKMRHEDMEMDKKLIEATLKRMLKKECFK